MSGVCRQMYFSSFACKNILLAQHKENSVVISNGLDENTESLQESSCIDVHHSLVISVMPTELPALTLNHTP